MDMIAARPSAQERFSQLLPFLASSGILGGGGQSGGSPAGPVGVGGPGTVVTDGDTDYRYRTFDQPYSGTPQNLVTRQGVTLQRGPMRSLIDIARESGILPGIQEIGEIGQGFRPYSAQQAGYAQDPNRFAEPGYSYHGQGLAIDAGWWSDRPLLARALTEAGWNQFDRGFEPWHYSYGVTG